MVLIDTSSWVHALRTNGDEEVRTRVRRLLEGGNAAWCPIVRLELWNGARGAHEKRVLRELEAALTELPFTEGVWAAAYGLARASRSAGHTLPATDVLIAACAKTHGVRLEHRDVHLDTLMTL